MILVFTVRVVFDHYRGAPIPSQPRTSSKISVDGSWGVLREETVMLDRPAAAFQPEAPTELRWVFGGVSPQQFRELIRSSGLTPRQQAGLLDEKGWQRSNDTITVRPAARLVQEMEPNARQRIYDTLALTPDNLAQRFPYVFHGSFEDWFAGCELPPDRLREVRRMIYRKGEVSIFADLPCFQATASSNEVQILVRHISRVPAVLASLQINERSDLGRLKRYWLSSSERKEFDPLLASLARVPGGTDLNVATLLPPLASRLLYSYPHPRPDFPRNANCVWTSMNFFNAQPDNRFVDERFTGEALNTQYRRVPQANAFGDIIMLYQPGADGGMKMIHMCVHIAGDIVFTKNGGDIYQPWVLMHLRDVQALFSYETGVQTAIFRRNGHT